MADTFAGYDAWLERPYQDAAKYDEDCERVAESLGLTEEEAAEFDYDTYFADQFDEPEFESEWTDEQYHNAGH